MMGVTGHTNRTDSTRSECIEPTMPLKLVEKTGKPPTDVDKRGERVRAMFGSVARRYDLLNHVLSLNIDRLWRRFCVKTVPANHPTAPILDVCTGTGDLALAYAKATKGRISVIGCDFCHEMLTVAERKVNHRRANVTLLEADAQCLPFANDLFQVVTVAFGLRNVCDTDAGIREMIRVCMPNGQVAILEFSRPRLPILKSLYLLYFRQILPRIGQSVAPNDHDAYNYLPNSVMEFPDGEAMVSLLESHGLRDVVAYPLTLGIATLYVGTKQHRTTQAESA